MAISETKVIRYYRKVCRKFVLRSFVNRPPGSDTSLIVLLSDVSHICDLHAVHLFMSVKKFCHV